MDLNNRGQNILWSLDEHVDWNNCWVTSWKISSDLTIELDAALLTSHPRFDAEKVTAVLPMSLKGCLIFPKLLGVQTKDFDMEVDHDSEGISLGALFNVFDSPGGYEILGDFNLLVAQSDPTVLTFE